MKEFEEAQAEYEAAKKRFTALLEKRARELYPHYDGYDEDDSYTEGGGAMTKVECRKTALATLKSGKTAQEILDDWEKGRQVMRTVYLPVKLDNDLRVIAFQNNQKKNAIIVDAVRIYLEALENAKDG